MARQQRSQTKNNRFTDWANQGLKMAHWPVSRVARLGLLIGIGVAIAALYLLQSSEIVTASRHVQSLRGDLAQLRHTNADLAVAISKAGSVDQLKQRAQAMGFESAQSVVYLPVHTLPVDDAPSLRPILGMP